ncbi:agmatine deiminase family protein [Piscirickettsia litoralis]|uniref:agmatine deiminase family protein n=1 Tax=Piscirickettsia litoralis TaxID=1891921 RepID=UPI000AB7AC1E|nr:agmatine deiminase family protein [Piscirickettsia litoralis]
MQYQLIPEWAPQQAVMITWPHIHSDWADTMREVEPSFLALAKAITDHQPLIITCYNPDHQAEITNKLTAFNINLNQVQFYTIPSNDTWCRDYGPLSTRDIHQNQIQLISFNFNAWGNKFASDLDNQVNTNLARQNAFNPHRITDHPLILEGGSVETDGHGTLLTTRRCLLNPNRNPKLSKRAIEAELKTTLGFQRILWLDHGELVGDDTDAHIDTLARFCDPHTICYVQCTDKNDRQHFDELAKMEQELKAFKNCQGQPYRLVPLPLPHCYRDDESNERLASSYAKFFNY